MTKRGPELANLLPAEAKGVDPRDQLLLEMLLHALPGPPPTTGSPLLHLLPNGVSSQQGVGALLHQELHHIFLLRLAVRAPPCFRGTGQHHLVKHEKVLFLKNNCYQVILLFDVRDFLPLFSTWSCPSCSSQQNLQGIR